MASVYKSSVNGQQQQQQCAVVNVGGKSFNIPFVKLTVCEPESLLTQLIRDQKKLSIVNRSATLFQYIVGYFNDGPTARWPQDPDVVKMLLREAEFFRLHGLIPILWRLLNGVPLVTAKLETAFKVRWNPGTINLYWQTVAIMTYCYAPRRCHFQVVGFVKSQYQWKDSSWWCFDVACPACAGFDFAPMEDLVDFGVVEKVMKYKMEKARGTVRKVCQNQCALVDWDIGWKFHMPLNALLHDNALFM